ncbi:uncharacterized protein LOC133186333 [Saccostrea echinata]|uniref:uncharacterized protein LOC133186333 n=1 Tax=Saccostrea echinata TaxID=191078 RepID=UPI002A83A876|nr:uncharacterized protein LOC133186333 [Saccostrea echinata]
MDPRFSAQDVLRCDLCEIPVPPMYCDFCYVRLCKACVGEHLSDLSKEHKVESFKQRRSTQNFSKCSTHKSKPCELHCAKCDIPVCSLCISGKHKGHTFLDIIQIFNDKKEEMKNDLQELEKCLHSKYEGIASEIGVEKSGLDGQYGKLTTAVIKQGEDWHREINITVNKQKSEIDEMKTKHLAALNKQEKDIKQITSNVKQSILDLKKILDSNDVSLISVYISRNAEFRSLPPKVNVSLPSFSHKKINTEQLHQMFGSLSALSITTEKHGHTMKTPEAVSCPPVKPLLDEPKLITTIDTGYKYLYSDTCLSDEEIWTCGEDKIMKLYNLQGKLLKSIKTKSRNIPRDIAVTRRGDLVYTDPYRRTVNIMKNRQIQELIRLQGWKPDYVCSTSSGDLLVTMNSDDGEQTKVVRYSGSTEKQTIQFDSEGKPLYSSHYFKYISENRNLDICVADYGASSVVMVNEAGKLRFRYTGHPSTTKETFYPYGITTDSQSQILTADCDNDCIHILDQDGQFLRYIDSCDLQLPWGLCVDTRDNLFVAEFFSDKVKKIKYM